MWLERSRDDPAVVLSIVDSVSLSGLRAASKVAPRSVVVGDVVVFSVPLVSRSFLTSNRTLVFSSMYALTSCKASVNAFNSGGVGVSAAVEACFGSSGVAATGVAWVSGGGEETDLGGVTLSSGLVVGGEAGGGSGGSAVSTTVSPSDFLGSDVSAGSGPLPSSLVGGSAVGSGEAEGSGAVVAGVELEARRARASRALAKMNPTSIPHGAYTMIRFSISAGVVVTNLSR